MAFEIKMPQLGLTMEEGTVAQWLKQEGDTVAKGDVLLEITTDKLTSEIESEADGVLLKIVAKEGEDVPVKGLLGYIGEPGEQVGQAKLLATLHQLLHLWLQHLHLQKFLPLHRLLHLRQKRMAAEFVFLLWQEKQLQNWA